MEEKEVKKPSYEDLAALVSKYEKESIAYKGLNSQLYQQLVNTNMANLYKRLDYLFKVVDSNAGFTSDFVIKCTEEIEQIMSPEEEPQVKE